MTLARPILASAVFLAGAMLVSGAQAQYFPYPYSYGYSYRQAQPMPRSWSYDPYTSGMASCPQWYPGDSQPCSEMMPPTYGQPDYWSR
jgi:hypothetical protein